MTETDTAGEGDTGAGVPNLISGGIFFHAVIQGRDITVQLPPQITPALSALPAASLAFTGRDTHVDQLLEGLAPHGGRQRASMVTAVAGLAGVGKTELVVQIAVRALRKPGWFPGGVLFVDLFGYDTERRLTPERALDGLLRALGIPGEHVPTDLQDRSRLYRSVLAAYAEQSQRVLVVIDNASTVDQVRPLLPTDGMTATLLTSRHTLDVDARLHDLDILDSDASVELIRQALFQARGDGDTRVSEAPEAAAAVARLCAGLPLALRIAAALLADIPTRPLASLVNALEAAHTRLDRLRRADRAVRAAFDLSYQHLDEQHASLFRLLPLNPGPDVSTESAAHLIDADHVQAEELLQDLARAHLIEPGRIWGRWRMHDLVRLYAEEHGRTPGATDQDTAALSRLLDHYQTTARGADTHLKTEHDSDVSLRFSDREQALAWLEEERPNLITTATTTPALGYPTIATSLADSLARFLSQRRYFDDLITLNTTALAVYREAGDLNGETMMLNNLGSALAQARRFEEAIDAHKQSLPLCRQLHDRGIEGAALLNLGTALQEARGFEESIVVFRQAVQVFSEIQDRHGEALVLNNLGFTLVLTRHFEEAIVACWRASKIFEATGDRHGEAMALNNLGTARLGVRQFSRAIRAHTRAAAYFEETGDRHGEGQALNNLGIALRNERRIDEAISAHHRAAHIYRETKDRHREGRALNNLGTALTAARRFDEAIEALTQDLAICHETGDRHGEGGTLNNLGGAMQGAGQFEKAIDAHTRAAAVFRETDDRHGEGQALMNLGTALGHERRFKEAINVYTQAAAAFDATGDSDSKSKALHEKSIALLTEANWLGGGSLSTGP
ncbi:tetratricopeptide repeat protein [Streptomyces olivochromogenes]|uniref:Transcriptional regulator n=1 Tax=Streptomyces olivochromogenes TaxID=1963 RepID=A0A250VUS8_STROL|nr:tetratricopeptide repeat protein [Streptomyces olivochromogenes]KUN35887.1 hypothetical protein AQJ27_47980 [Streptomyces olivochromogenes]GAX57891.1 transcriptional regulator [Streptomyces olivochromogenes]